MWKSSVLLAVFMLLAGAGRAGGADIVPARAQPRPLSHHPGNVFLEGEEVVVPVAEPAARWRLLDDRLHEVNAGVTDSANAVLGELAVGWYRLESLDEEGALAGFTTLAVLAPLQSPTPPDSPICLDVALSWLADEEPDAWRDLAGLAALAGCNWVRDRIHWREVQPEEDRFIPETKYDRTARIQQEAGLNVLQVFHTAPEWAQVPAAKRRLPDLRHVFRFCRAMAKRFEGTVRAWEPWNEGNARNFGGYTMDELCAHQKAAWLGFKAGAPELTVCWQPIGGIDTEAQAAALIENETWPYFDVYSIHSYDWAHAYARLWEPARKAACGRPIWVTECDRGMKAAPESEVGDFTQEMARRKAEFVIQSYACSLFAGSVRHFHFILPHYMEGGHRVQFGLLRKDHTPRLSYVALAALGRLLAGGQCLGRWEEAGDETVQVYAFRAQPDGKRRDVLVAWTEARADWPGRGSAAHDFQLPDGLKPEAVYDYLGRPVAGGVPGQLRSSPVFIVLPEKAADTLPLKQIGQAERRPGNASRVVFQLVVPGKAPEIRQEAWTQEPMRVFTPGETSECVLYTCNLGQTPASGQVTFEVPTGWQASESAWETRLAPMGRLQQRLTLTAPSEPWEEAWLRVRGHFGEAGKPVLAVQAYPPVERTASSE